MLLNRHYRACRHFYARLHLVLSAERNFSAYSLLFGVFLLRFFFLRSHHSSPASAFIVLCISSRIYNLIMIRYLPLPADFPLASEIEKRNLIMLPFLSLISFRLLICVSTSFQYQRQMNPPTPNTRCGFCCLFSAFLFIGWKKTEKDSSDAEKKVIKKTINKLTPSNKWFISCSFHHLFPRLWWIRSNGNFT